MQAAQCLSSTIHPLPKTQTKSFLALAPSSFRFNTSISFAKYKAAAAATSTEIVSETSTVDYSSLTSVFPAEACEIIGGDACNVNMFPEGKLPLPQEHNNNQLQNTTTAQEEAVDREYLDYNGLNKTVFLEEACDNLGGEFCYPGYLRDPTY